MRQIQILGTGCPKCKLLTAHAEEAVKALGIEAQIEKVEKIQDIMKLNGTASRIETRSGFLFSNAIS